MKYYETEPFKFLESINQNNLNMRYNYDNIAVEIFKIIDNSIAPGVKENMYSISNIGRVFNIRTGHELSQFVHSNYYMCVSLQLPDGTHKTYYVHRLVAMAFIPKTEEDIKLRRDMVNHKDLRPWNNYFENLEWTTNRENSIHAIINNVKDIIMPLNKISNWWINNNTNDENNGMARLSNDQVHHICRLLEQKVPRKEIAREVGLDENSINCY